MNATNDECSRDNPHPYLGHSVEVACPKLLHHVEMKNGKPITKQQWDYDRRCGACHVNFAIPHRADAPDAKLCEPCYQKGIRAIQELIRQYGPTAGRR